MRRILLLLLVLLAHADTEDKKAFKDDTNPRSPGTPLQVVFTPYTCTRCVQPDQKPKSVQLMRMPMEELAKTLGLEEGSWIVIQSPHFKMLSTLRPAKSKLSDSSYCRADLERLKVIFPKFAVGRDGAFLDAHERAHLYHIRAERLYAHFAALTDCAIPYLGMGAPYEFYLFDDYAEHHALVDKFIGSANDKAGNQHHDKEEPNFMAFTTSESQVSRVQGKGEGIFAGHVIHNLAHLLVDGHLNYHRETWGWLEEGLAHYYENREYTSRTFCWAEGKAPSDFLKPNWAPVVFGIVRRGRDDPLGEWCEKLQPGQLTGTQNGLSWSIVTWLVETEPVRFTKMLEKFADHENKPSCEQCIEFAFGASPTVLHNRWREYVLKEYLPK